MTSPDLPLSAADDAHPARKASISRDDLLAAALALIGPHRSVSTLSLREVAREAGIAPNSFYRQFRDMDELTVALIDLSGRSLRTIIGEARQRAASSERSVIREPPAPLRLHQHNALLADLCKTALERLVAFRPTHLIFDFIDERFDLISVGDAIVSHTWELEVSGYLEQKAFRARRPIPRLSAACSRRWRQR